MSTAVADPVLDEAQKAVDALESGTTPDAPVSTTETDAPAPDTVTDAVDYSSLILPKDAVIDGAALERTVAIARARGLSAEQAQPIVDLINQEVAQSRADLLAAHQPGGAEWTKKVDAWKAEAHADTSLGKTDEEWNTTVDRGASVLKKFAEMNPAHAADFTAFLDQSGLQHHPSTVRFLAWLGKAAGERKLVTGSDSSVGTGDARAMFTNSPNMNP